MHTGCFGLRHVYQIAYLAVFQYEIVESYELHCPKLDSTIQQADMKFTIAIMLKAYFYWRAQNS